MTPISQQHLDALRGYHGNMTGLLQGIQAVPRNQYIPVDDLLDAIKSLSTDITYPDGTKPRGYIFGSATIDLKKEVPYQKYTEAIVKTHSGFSTIGDTQAAQFISKVQLSYHLQKAIQGEGSDLEPQHTLHGYMEDGRRQQGLWDDISRGFAQNAQGDIVTVTPNSNANRIFVQTELPALLENSKVNTINGVPRQEFVDKLASIVKTMPEHANMMDAYAKLDATMVRPSSERFLKRFAAAEFAADYFNNPRNAFVQSTDTTLTATLDQAAPPQATASDDTFPKRAISNAVDVAPSKPIVFTQAFDVLSDNSKSLLKNMAKSGKIVLRSLPFAGAVLGVGLDSAEAKELDQKIVQAIADQRIPADALLSYRAILSAHVGKNADQTDIAAESLTALGYEEWAKEYGVTGELKAALKPSTPMLELLDAGRVVSQFASEKTRDGASFLGSQFARATDQAIDLATGSHAMQVALYDALPSMDVKDANTVVLNGAYAAFNDNPSFVALIAAKARIEHHEARNNTQYLADARDTYKSLAESLSPDELDALYRTISNVEDALRIQTAATTTTIPDQITHNIQPHKPPIIGGMSV